MILRVTILFLALVLSSGPISAAEIYSKNIDTEYIGIKDDSFVRDYSIGDVILLKGSDEVVFEATIMGKPGPGKYTIDVPPEYRLGIGDRYEEVSTEEIEEDIAPVKKEQEKRQHWGVIFSNKNNMYNLDLSGFDSYLTDELKETDPAKYRRLQLRLVPLRVKQIGASAVIAASIIGGGVLVVDGLFADKPYDELTGKEKASEEGKIAIGIIIGAIGSYVGLKLLPDSDSLLKVYDYHNRINKNAPLRLEKQVSREKQKPNFKISLIDINGMAMTLKYKF